MTWEPAGAFLTFCPLDITFYPFDTQTCALTFVDWVYSDGKVNEQNQEIVPCTGWKRNITRGFSWVVSFHQVRLEIPQDEIFMDSTYYQKSGEWRILRTSTRMESVQYETNETFARVSFIVVINVSSPGIVRKWRSKTECEIRLGKQITPTTCVHLHNTVSSGLSRFLCVTLQNFRGRL